MRTPRALITGGLVGLLAACASPADVEADYDTARRAFDAARDTRDADMAAAVEWNTHTLWIPASGWLAVVIVGVIVGAVLLGLLGLAVYRVLGDRREKRYGLELQRERTAEAAAQRGPCKVCGAESPGLGP